MERKKERTKNKKPISIELKEFRIRTVSIDITSKSPLIVHAFSEKSRKMIEDKQQGKSKNAKHKIRVPEEDYEQAKHVSPLGWEGFPTAGFKAAMIRGAKMIGLVMKDMQTNIFIKADCEKTQLTKINGESRMRTDMVRIGQGSADVRYRPEYPEWNTTLVIEYNEGMVSVEQIYQMVYAAGYGVGIGEMRPERTKFGFGRFEIVK